ncbi:MULTISPECIES: ISL3 family transposase [unclassified Nocardioides]|uniref:ISL3 family transposase n=1 Tax=unclassified Nocardioides TaxID=2615069 RepID=UPI0007033C33|nr:MULTISPECIES: ISL3 family transposase [unclassified Nocardioides]KRC57344.1 transposase [Nocardioides sp. Root79]KRC74186.1 transposase [Nocardioides sp. Root240]
MALVSLWRGLLGLEHTAIENVRRDGDVLVVDVRPMARQRDRCGRCRRRCPRYDTGRGRRRWRSLDQGTTLTFLEADAPRVRCRQHGVVVAHVPWAAHDAGHTHTFDAQVAWLATKTSKAATTELMRIAWRTVGAIIARVWDAAEAAAPTDGLDGLSRIGIDEISYRRNMKYLTVVVDHDTGLLVWAGEGRSRATLRAFFDELGPERCAQLTHVSADGASWIEEEVTLCCPNVVIGIDPFHVVKWANEALARVRIDAWQDARRLARFDPPTLTGWARRSQWLPGRDLARGLKGSRFALSKNPENLTDRQRAKLEWIATADPRLYRAYLLKEALRLVFQMPPEQARPELDRWLAWARRCRIPAFVELARKIRRYRDRILTAIEHNLSNGRVEGVNTRIRLLTRIAFGFHTSHALIALAMLSLGRHRPALPGRT